MSTGETVSTAQQIIDKAIAENRLGERLLYAFACVFVFCGLLMMFASAYRHEGELAIAGSVASGLFFPAMREAKQMRRENMAIRLLEEPLSRAETAKEAGESVREFFKSICVTRRIQAP